MSDSGTGKELVLTSPSEVTRRSKPSLIEVKGRYLSSDGRFHPTLAAQYIEEKGMKKWVGVADLSRVFTAANTIPGKKRVRKNMSRVFTEMLQRGHFLLYSTGGNGRIESVKVLDITMEEDRQAALPQLERMKRRRQLSEERYQDALCLIKHAEDARKA